MTGGFSFVAGLSARPSAAPAIFCEQDGVWTPYGALADQVAAAARAFARPRRFVVFLLFSNRRSDVVAYLGLLAAGHVPVLIDPLLDGDLLRRLLDSYRPEMVAGDRAGPPSPDWRPVAGSLTAAWEQPGGGQSPPHSDLALLLTTSGSTGSPKLVRLSAAGLEHNAQAIVAAFGIGAGDRAVAHLPLHYSFGLSILHTHLAAGASLLLTGGSMMEASFWDRVRALDCTSLPGTPFHYRMLERLGLERLEVPSLALMIQAGGRLDPALARAMHARMTARGGRFCVMYGQTEASPRMTVLPHDRFDERPGSVGLPLADGRVYAIDGEGQRLRAGAVGEIVYHGPNVMMGYAHGRDDLTRGDEMGGVLRTGDLGYVDEAGYLFLTGRANRFAKVTGLRINLDEVEQLAGPVRVAAVEGPRGILLFAERLSDAEARDLRRGLSARLRLGPGALTVRVVGALPVTAKGKIDYARLRDEA